MKCPQEHAPNITGPLARRLLTTRWMGWRLAGFFLLAPFVLLSGGCPQPADGDEPAPFLDVDGNFDFDNATALSIDGGLRFRGRIDGPGDADIYGLGNLMPGDRLVVDLQATSGDLDAVLAIFDNRQLLHAFNDDRASGNSLDPRIDIVIRGGEPPFFFGVVALQGSDTTGSYEVTVEITPDVGVPPTETLIVYLDYRAADDVRVENVGTFDLEPFSANQLGFPSARTAEFKSTMEAFIRERYADYNFVLLSSDTDPVPSEPHSTIYFGGTHPTAFAISQQIDTYNADPNDDAIIFTGSFEEAYGGFISFNEMVNAVGNTVAHEIGHLLGMVHTNECSSLMDTRCGNISLLTPQEFRAAPLDFTVFPIGSQDAAELIGWTIGLVGL